MVWKFMGGWRPELLPMVMELFGIEDPEALMQRLAVLRDA